MSLNLLEVGAPALKTKLMMIGQPSIVQGCMDALTLKEAEPVQWMLQLLYDILREDSSCFSVFEDALKRKAGFCAPLMQILKSKENETPTDVCIADKSAWLLSAIMAHVPGCFSNGDVLELVGAVTNQPRCSELGVLETITNLLKSDVFRGVVWGQGNVKDVINSVNVKTAEASVVYKYVFSIWLLSFDAGLADDLKALKVVDKLRDIIAVNRVEKVVRISLTALSNLLPSKELCEQIVESNVLDSVQNLEYEKWRDAELYDEIREMSSSISNAVQEVSNFDRYERELQTGKLSWGACHTSKFWGENIMKLDKNNFKNVKDLAALLCGSGDTETLAVACYDVGQFVALHPLGKKKVVDLGIKDRVMELMITSGEENREMRREALLCCQKIMLNKWQEAAAK
jgi:V-type H+-transporting ATPase subunit H